MDAARSGCRSDHVDAEWAELRASLRQYLFCGGSGRDPRSATVLRIGSGWTWILILRRRRKLHGSGCEERQHEQLHQPNAGVPVVVGVEPSFVLEVGPNYPKQPECGDPIRPGVGH